MKPIAIFRHTPSEGPGYFATFLNERSIPWQIIETYKGERVANATDFSGLVFMGGPMSVNDPLPWIPHSLQLIRDAVSLDVPVLGHCLGGQLMSKALGGVVTRNPVKEIGWGNVRVTLSEAQGWLTHVPPVFEVFHWHGETFTVPSGATRILASDYCENQAFVMGKHLGMQCHVEMTVNMINAWLAVGAEELRENATRSVQTADAMLIEVEQKVEGLHRVATGFYSRWLEGVDVS